MELANPTDALLKRILVIVAHPDDECIGTGALLQEMQEAEIVFCTDGGPHDSFFWQKYGSREQYVKIRRSEAECAAAAVNAKRLHFLPIIDQELYLCLDRAIKELERIASEFRPDAILTLAYEGGHPDHDSCAFLSYALGTKLGIEVWEMPIYHRTGQGPGKQQFLQPSAGTWQPGISQEALARKKEMLSCYV